MVGLPNYTTKYIDKYCNDIGNKVYDESLKNMLFWEKYFPESTLGMVLSKQFFFDILSLTINECCEKYDSVKLYYDFAFFTSLNIKEIHAKEKSQKKRILNRKNYIDKYVKGNTHANRILNNFLIKKDPIRNDKNFEELQLYMGRFLEVVNYQIKKASIIKPRLSANTELRF